MSIFRDGELRAPLAGLWRLQGTTYEYPGVLTPIGDELHLTIFLTDASIAKGEMNHPALIASAPPAKPTIVGTTRQGLVSLHECSRMGLQSTGAKTEATFWPASAWLSSKSVDPDCSFEGASFEVQGLHSILSTLDVQSYHLDYPPAEGEEDREIYLKLSEISGADEAILIDRGNPPIAEIVYSKKHYSIEIYTSTGHSHSVSSGIGINSGDIIHISSPEATLEEFRTIADEVEKFLGIFSLAPIRRQRFTLKESDKPPSPLLFWQLGAWTGDGEERMPHQVWCRLGAQPELFKSVLQAWFSASEGRRLARWLIFDAMRAESLSSSTFLAAAQAWEILGRELGTAEPAFEKAKFSAACDEAIAVLAKHLGAPAAERYSGLLKSSNQSSFRDLITLCVKRMPGEAVAAFCGTPQSFTKRVADVRNVLTHLEDKKKLSVHEASRQAGELTLRLLAGFCMIEARLLGLPMNNVSSVIRHNKLAKMAAWTGE